MGASKTHLLDLSCCFLVASLLHPAVQYCLFIEATLSAFISDWLLRDQKVLLLWRTQDAIGVFPLSHGLDLRGSRPSSCRWLLSQCLTAVPWTDVFCGKSPSCHMAFCAVRLTSCSEGGIYKANQRIKDYACLACMRPRDDIP